MIAPCSRLRSSAIVATDRGEVTFWVPPGAIACTRQEKRAPTSELLSESVREVAPAIRSPFFSHW